MTAAAERCPGLRSLGWLRVPYRRRIPARPSARSGNESARRPRLISPGGSTCFMLLLLGLAAFQAGAAPKTDLILLRNGDRLTGEIKRLEHNLLVVSTDHMGTVNIEWDKILRLQTDQTLLLERSDGVRYYGQLAESGSDLMLAVRQEEASDEVPMASIVRARPIESGSLIDRLDGYVSAGLDLSQASSRRSLDFAAGLSSRTRTREWSVDGSASATSDSAGATSERYTLQGTWRRLLPQRAFYQGFGGIASNTELDLDLRTLLGGVYGRYFVQTGHAEWLGGVGLAYSHENYAGGETLDSVELVLTTDFSIFNYDFPETDIGGTLSVLPSLTQSGRYRAEADLHARYEFVDDLYFELKLYGSYDSEPPVVDAQSTDYGVTTSLGYSF